MYSKAFPALLGTHKPVKPIYLVLSSEINYLLRDGFWGEGGWSCIGHPTTTTTTTTPLHEDRCTVDLSLHNLGSDCAVPACVSLHYVFNPVKQLYHVHGNPGFVLHQLQQIYYGILYLEIRGSGFLAIFSQAHFIHATQGSLFSWLWFTKIRRLDLYTVDIL